MKNEERIHWNKQIVNTLCAELGIPIKWIQEYHVRIQFKAGAMDFYPGKQRAFILSSRIWFFIKDIEAYIQDNVNAEKLRYPGSDLHLNEEGLMAFKMECGKKGVHRVLTISEPENWDLPEDVKASWRKFRTAQNDILNKLYSYGIK